MTYPETCEYLFNQIPMFERQGASGYKEGLSNTLALDEHLGHPHRSFATIHVGGTNGKGSVSHTLAAILQEAGFRVGLYTSPHLIDFRERIRINGKPISEEYVVDFVEKERSFFEPLHPSFFEVATALAFKYFHDEKIDIAVVEVGLGGRLDCTNIITPLVSVITNISFDHTQFLGDTLAKIAAEKAGIIKRGVPVVIGEAIPETRPVFEQKAQEMEAPIIFAEDHPEVTHAAIAPEGGMQYDTKHWGKLWGDLGGIYQQKNMNTVLTAISVLKQQGLFDSPALKQQGPFDTPVLEKQGPFDTPVLEKQYHRDSPAREGFAFPKRFTASTPKGSISFPTLLQQAVAHVATSTGLMGRWQVVRQQPTVVCDTGHNMGGWQYISAQLQAVKCRQMHIVFGMVSDKDIEGVLQLLPKHAIFYFTQAHTPRAIDKDTVQSLAAKYGLQGKTYPTVNEAYKAALASSDNDDFIFVGGSSYVVGEFLESGI